MKLGTGVHLDTTRVDHENQRSRSLGPKTWFRRMYNESESCPGSIGSMPTQMAVEALWCQHLIRNTLKSLVARSWAITIHYRKHCTDLLFTYCVWQRCTCTPWISLLANFMGTSFIFFLQRYTCSLAILAGQKNKKCFFFLVTYTSIAFRRYVLKT